MTIKNFLHFIFVFTIFSISPVNLQAQVTIGSGIPPSMGALLDLKEYDSANGESNSTKGLLLPRVNLTDWRSLYPMFSTDPDYINNMGDKKVPMFKIGSDG
ncbi:hypothetical protein [Dysgonomonas termitidis]|uniref:Uncharacterized protein n=1 Tax=Dysgonomonas termitidis TaxID=1516126 RepID=A0ABV9KTQ3_9BACT